MKNMEEIETVPGKNDSAAVCSEEPGIEEPILVDGNTKQEQESRERLVETVGGHASTIVPIRDPKTDRVHPRESDTCTVTPEKKARTNCPNNKVSELPRNHPVRNPYKTRSPMRQYKYTEMSEAALEGRADTTSFAVCAKCHCEFAVLKAKKYYMCPGEKCSNMNEDIFRDDQADAILSVPKNSEVQSVCFDELKDMFSGIFMRMITDGGPKEPTIALLWEMKNKAIEGELLLEDRYTKQWNQNKGLQDAISNCVTSLDRKDKVGFRNSFLTLMYMVMVGYSHITTTMK